MKETTKMESQQNKKEYHCEICDLKFDSYNPYYKHRIRKNPCISKEKYKEVIQENKRMKYIIEMKLKNEIETKDKLIQELQQSNELKDKSLIGISHDIKEMKQSVNNVHDKLDNKNDIVNVAYNNFTNNNTLNQINQIKNELCNFSFTIPKKERLDHIPGSVMMEYLNSKSLNETLGKIMGSVYFDVSAPQNFRWCITDSDAQYGALEYNKDSNTLTRKSTNEVISNQVKNVIFQVTDVIEELRMKHTFNQKQLINCNKLYGLAGTELDPSDMKGIKEAAYERRNFPKTLWDFLGIPVEVTELNCQVHLKHNTI